MIGQRDGRATDALPSMAPVARIAGNASTQRPERVRQATIMLRRRRGCGCLPALLILVLLGVGLFVVDVGADYLLFAPWAYGLPGQPTLTGSWAGTLRTHSGVPYAVYLQINRDRTSKGQPLNTRGNANIDGTVSYCARSIKPTSSTIYGHANRSASSVIFESDEIRNPPPGLFPLHFDGAWHRTTLALHVVFYLVRNHAYVFSTSIPDAVHAVPLTLRKQDRSAFTADCARLGA